MKRRFFLGLVAGAALVYALGTGPAAAAPFDQAAKQFVASLAPKAATLLTKRELSQAQRARNLFAFIDDVVDVPTIARFTLGRYWRKATEEQRAEFIDVFRQYIALSVIDRIGRMAGAAIDIQKVVPVKASPKNKDVLVICRVRLAEDRSMGVVWRVRDTRRGPKLVDVIVDGISMAVVQREEFGSVLRTGGGDVGSFIVALREKTAQAGPMVADIQE